MVMEPSDRYLWRMRPAFSGQFENASLNTDHNGFRIDSFASDSGYQGQDAEWIILGPSSAFGWGVELGDTYSSFAAKAKGRRLLNASQVGYGISQGLRVYEDHREEWKATPKTIFIAYGVNDVDRFRFFGPIGISDREAFAKPDTLDQLRMEKWIYRFAFSGLLMRAMQEGAVRFGCPGKSKFEIRESESGFLESLAKLVESVTADGHQPIVIDSPFRYPFKTDSALAELASDQFAKAHEAAQAGNCVEAKRLFGLARVNEPHRVALAIESVNRGIKNLATARSWRLVEASTMVKEADDFVDPIHFSVKGHKLIGEGVLRELGR